MVSKLAWEVDAAVETETSIREDVNPLSLEIGGGVDYTDLSSLNKVVGNEEVLLVGTDLQIVRSNDALVFIRVVNALEVVQVGNIECRNMIAEGKREVGKLAVVGGIGVDGEVLTSTRAEIEEQLCDALVAIGVLTERVDDPDLARAYSGGEGGGLFVAGDKLDVLDTLTIRDSDGRNDLARAKLPQTKRVGLLNADGRGRLQNGNGYDEVRGQNDVLVEANAQTVRAELLAENVESTLHILRPLVNDVKLSVSFDEATRRGTGSGAHVGDEEASIGLCADLICDRRKQGAVALLELRLVRIGCVEVVSSVLGLHSDRSPPPTRVLPSREGPK